MHPASVFIMDVSSSSSAESIEELSGYLAGIEGWINEWFEGRNSVRVKHRAGDELILLAEGYASAFVAAFYINRIWKYGKNRPYFGLSFGSIEKEINEIDLEKWIHPIVKQARLSNEVLKKQKEREAFRFHNEAAAYSEYIALVNGMLKLQYALALEQTEVQSLVCSLYLIYGKQNAVAELLGRSAPTIYSHFKKGHSEVIIGSYHEILNVLCSIQDKDFNSDSRNDIWRLEERIQEHLKTRVLNVFEL